MENRLAARLEPGCAISIGSSVIRADVYGRHSVRLRPLPHQPIASFLNVDNRYSPDSALCILASCSIATPIHELSDRECFSPAAPSSGVPFLGNSLAASYEGEK